MIRKKHLAYRDDEDEKIVAVLQDSLKALELIYDYERYRNTGQFDPKSQIIRTMMKVYGAVQPYLFDRLGLRVYRLKYTNNFS